MRSPITLFSVLLLLLVISTTHVFAVELDTEISDSDKEAFDEILTPVIKIYNFIKYTASVIGVIFLLFAGITFMTSGTDFKKRDDAKYMAAYTLIGLVIIWAAPFMVNLIL
tara:strand:+ start:45 stop:377 length:333 start_codon:yes stop_codon:yes gene_type:complete